MADSISITGGDFTGGVSEDTNVQPIDSLGTTGSIEFTDAEGGFHVPVVDAVGTPLGSLIANMLDDSDNASDPGFVDWIYSVDNAAVQYLSAGETLTEEFDITITGADGEELTQRVTVTITGTNDAPTISAATGAGIDSGEVTETAGLTADDTPVEVNGVIDFSDIDLSDVHSASATAVVLGGEATGLVAVDTAALLALLAAPVTQTDGLSTDGTINWTFSAANSLFDYLDEGATATLTYTLTLDDGQGGSDTVDVTITVTGTNDAPLAVADTGSALVEEGAAGAGEGLSTGNVLDNDSDVDSNALLTVTMAGVAAADMAIALGDSIDLTGTYGILTLGSDGSYSYALDNGNPATDALAEGAVVTETFTYEVADEDGGDATTGQIVITVNGANDAPVLGNVSTPSLEVTEPVDAAAWDIAAVNGTIEVSDVDGADTLSPTVGAAVVVYNGGATLPVAFDISALVNGMTVAIDNASSANGATRTVTWTYDPAAIDLDWLNEGDTIELTFPVSISDGDETVMQNVTVTVTGSNDAPVVIGETADATEDGMPVTGNVAANDSDTDFEDDALYALDDTAPDGFTLETDGAWSFNPGVDAYQYLSAGQELMLEIGYTRTDGAGAAVGGTLTLTVVGTNDPVTLIGGVIGQSLGEDEASLVVGGTLNFADVDTNDELSVSVTATNSSGTVSGLAADFTDYVTATVDGRDVTWSFDPGAATFQYLANGESVTMTYTLTVEDGQGSSVDRDVFVNINGTNDIPVVEAVSATVAENAAPTTIVPVYSDVDTSDVLALSIDTTGTLGSVSIVDGAFVYDPGTAFDGLIQDEEATDTFTYTVDDGNGGVVTQTVTVTIAGENDAPVVSGAVTATVSEGSGIQTVNPVANVTDADIGEGAVVLIPAVLPAGVSFVAATALTIDFEDYALGSVVGQNGWTDASPNSPANAIVDIDGDQSLLLANDPASGDFGGPYSPALAFSVGENITGANGDTISFAFTIRAVSEVADGSRMEIDFGQAAFNDRFNFMAVEYVDGGLRLVQSTPTLDGNWTNDNGVAADFTFGTGNVELIAGLDPTVDHTIEVRLRTVDGLNNDVIEFWVNGDLVGTGGSFENFYANFTSGWDPADYSVNRILFRGGEAAGNPFPVDGAGPNRQGFLIDDVTISAFDSQTLQIDTNDPAYDYLAAGEELEVVVNYDVTDGHTTTAASTVFTVVGTNDGPEAEDVTGSAGENSGAIVIAPIVNDVDVTDTHTITIASEPASGVAAVNEDGEIVFDADGDFEYLAEGETAEVTFTYTANDGNGGTDTGTVTVTVTGTNDAPVLTAGVVSGSVNEPVGLTGEGAVAPISGSFAVADADTNGQTEMEVSFGSFTTNYGARLAGGLTDEQEAGLVAALSLTPLTGNDGTVTWTFEPDNSALDFIRFGETLTVVLNVTVDDGAGGTAVQPITITINGNNDTIFPGAINDLEGAVSEPDMGMVTDTGTIQYEDADFTNHVVLVSRVGGSSTISGGAMTATIGNQALDDGMGELEWSYSIGAAATDFLAVGETRVEVFQLRIVGTASDELVQNVTVTITGTNDAPVIDTVLGDFSAALTEVADVTRGEAELEANGSINFGDVDLLDRDTDEDTENGVEHSVAVTVAASGATMGGLTEEDLASLFTTTVTQTDGTGTGGGVDWAFAINDSALDYLSAGEVLTLTYTLTVSDSNGGTDTRDVVITITGSNDLPIVEALTGNAVEDGAAIVIAPDFTDADLADELTVTIDTTGTLGSVTINMDGDFVYEPGTAFQSLAAGETTTDSFTYTVDDGNGGVVTQGVTVTITGTNDDPVVEALVGAALEDGEAIVIVPVFSDVDLADTLTVTIDDTDLLGSVTINGDGNFVYDPGEQFQSLADGETSTDVFSYTIDDGIGGVVTQSVTVTITGTNDTPVLAVQVEPLGVTEDSVLDATVAVLASDVDATDTHMFSIVGSTPAGLTLNPDGSFTLDAGDAAYQHLAEGATQVVTFDYIATDDSGTGNAASDPQTITITVTGANDAPEAVADMAALTENVGGTFNLIGNDTDVDDDNVLTLSAISLGSVTGLGTLTDGELDAIAADFSIFDNELVFAPPAGLPSGVESVYDRLSAGESAVLTIGYTVMDEFGASSMATFTLTINGAAEASTGTAASDTIIGTTLDDMISGLAGADTLLGEGGDDFILGGASADTVFGGVGDDSLFGEAGNDLLLGGDGDDIINGGANADIMVGGLGNDTYYVDSGSDVVTELSGEGIDTVITTTSSYALANNVENLTLAFAGNANGYGNTLGNVITGNGANNVLSGLAGDDTLIGGGGNDQMYGGTGADTMTGGTGDDTYYIDNVGDTVTELAEEGNDLVSSSISYELGDHLERLTLTGSAAVNGTGNDLDNVIRGNNGANTLSGGGGADSMYGGNGNDVIRGGAGRDNVWGDAGADRFVFADGDFSGNTAATADVIRDFSQAQGDRIDLSMVDAITGDANDAFTFLGTGAFTGTAGELRYVVTAGITTVQGDTDGDGVADFWIRMVGETNLVEGDFVL